MPPAPTPEPVDGLADTLTPAAPPPSAVATLPSPGGPAGALATGQPAVTRGAPTTVLPAGRGGAAPASGPRERFAQLKLLGEGGMGQVALVEDHDIGRTVAFKRMKGATHPEAVARFAEEVRVIGQLDHPGVVPVYDVGVDDRGDYFLVMKHVQGETMEQIIERLRAGDPAYRRRYTQAYRAEILAAVLETVEYAHARGFIHRDLKPANIMVGPYGEVTVLDWGIAKRVGEKDPAAAELRPRAGDRLVETQHGALIGTPMYMSPEQARGQNDALDARSDVYALTVLLWEFLSLEHPRAGKASLQEVIAAVANEPLGSGFSAWVGMSSMRAGVSCEYAWFARKGLEHEPAQRYADAGEMLRELRAVMRGEFPVSCHVTAARRGIFGSLRWIDRHGVAFNALFVGGIGLALYGLGRLALDLLH